jgi:hypothetical protein
LRPLPHATPSLLLAGPLCAGKSSLAALLRPRGFTVVTALDAIERAAGRRGLSRDELQEVGAKLEAERPGAWLAEAALGVPWPVVLDSVRTPEQAREARNLLPGARVVHLTAPRLVRRARFEHRIQERPADVAADFDVIAASPLELGADDLAESADLALDTGSIDPAQVLSRVLDYLASRARRRE